MKTTDGITGSMASLQHLATIETVAETIIAAGGIKLAGQLIDVLLSCEDKNLTDDQAETGSKLFEALCRTQLNTIKAKFRD